MATVFAYNLRLKKQDKMNLKKIIKFKTKGGNVVRYRLSGVGSDGTKMSKFVSRSDAQRLSTQHRISISQS